jgi:hypothetical protein
MNKRQRISGAVRPPEKHNGPEELLAAVRLQRAWRRAHAIRNELDPSTQEPVPRGAARFLLVESSSVAYKFDGPTFAASVLCSGSFLHPVLRRELVGPEVKRLGRAAGLGRFGRSALRVAFDYRRQASAHGSTQGSLVSFLEGEAGTALDISLNRAEFFDGTYMMYPDHGVLAYSDALDSLVMCHPHAVAPLVSLHSSIVSLRKDAWVEVKKDLVDVMTDALHSAEYRMMRALRRGRPLPRTALGAWLCP